MLTVPPVCRAIDKFFNSGVPYSIFVNGNYHVRRETLEREAGMDFIPAMTGARLRPFFSGSRHEVGN